MGIWSAKRIWNVKNEIDTVSVNNSGTFGKAFFLHPPRLTYLGKMDSANSFGL